MTDDRDRQVADEQKKIQIKTAETINTETNTAEMLAINERLVIAAVRQQELAETALRAEQRLRTLVHDLDAVICEVDVPTGQTAFLSLRADTFLGYPLDHWHAQPNFLAEIIHPSDRERVTALFPAFGQDRRDYEYEFRALSADMDFIWMRNIVRLVHSAQGNAGNIGNTGNKSNTEISGIGELLRCVIVDVTAQKEAAQALEETHQALETTHQELGAAYAREHTIAETLQRSMMFMPHEDAFPGLAVKTIYAAASHESMVGGDFWDTFACDHGHVALILGDVMGHGLPAAVFTAELKYTLRGFVREHEHPNRILTQMNAYIWESHRLHQEGLNPEGDDAPVCLTVAIVDTATGESTVACAAMEAPLLMRSDGQMEETKVQGLPLGIQEDAMYVETTFRLGPGDWMILTTDGVTEARQGAEFLGPEGVMRLAQAERLSGTLEKPGTLENVGQAILAGARAFAGGKLMDDACVLLARRQ